MKERLFDMSDPFQVHTCGQCGFIANNLDTCGVCFSDDIVKVNIPYAAKLLVQQIQSMNIKVLIFPDRDEF